MVIIIALTLNESKITVRQTTERAEKSTISIVLSLGQSQTDGALTRRCLA